MALTEPFSDCRTFDARIGSVKKNNVRAIGPSISGLILASGFVTCELPRMQHRGVKNHYCTTTSWRARSCDAQGYLQFLQHVMSSSGDRETFRNRVATFPLR